MDDSMLWIGAFITFIVALLTFILKWESKEKPRYKRNNIIASILFICACGGIYISYKAGLNANAAKTQSAREESRLKRKNEELTYKLLETQSELITNTKNQLKSSDSILGYSRRLNISQGDVINLQGELYRNFKGEGDPLITFMSAKKGSYVAILKNTSPKYSMYKISATIFDYDYMKECQVTYVYGLPSYSMECLLKNSHTHKEDELGANGLVVMDYIKYSTSNDSLKQLEVNINTRNGTYIQQLFFKPSMGMVECGQYYKLYKHEKGNMKLIASENSIPNFTISDSNWKQAFLPMDKYSYTQQ